MELTLEQRKNPIGKFVMPTAFDSQLRQNLIKQIEELPGKLMAAVGGMTESMLDKRYREGGWTARQVIHHLPDSHVNAYIRLKLALTEHNPTVRPYDENAWSELPDGKTAPVASSLMLLGGLHNRFTLAFRNMKEEEFSRPLIHPAYNEPRNIDWILALYAWHGNNHLSQVKLVADGFGVD